MGSKRDRVGVKRGRPHEEIKEYAETAMNELLGWYGYEKVDSRETKHLDLHHFAPRPAASPSPPPPTAANTTHSHPDGTSSSDGEEHAPVSVPAGCEACAWCRKVAEARHFSLKTATARGTASFCTEVCFGQWRRASFKRTRTCDWCRHTRHTVNYVDFQDGDHQLQFCSDKCLNQYKMNIFCKETEAHLQLHPHLQEGAAGGGVGSGGTKRPTPQTLITPDLWLRDCRSPHSRSRSHSPDTLPSPIVEITTTPTPPPAAVKPSPPISPEPDPEPTNLSVKNPRTRRLRGRRSHKVQAPLVTPLPQAEVHSSPRSASTPPRPPYPLPPPDHPVFRPPFFNPGFPPPPHLMDFAARFPFPRPPLRAPRPMNGIPPLLPLPRGLPPPPPPPSLLPPPTLMVPYPVLIPVPIPVPVPMLIPIPIPPDFKLKQEPEVTVKTEIVSPPSSPPPANLDANPEPPAKRKRPDPSEERPLPNQKSVPA